MRFFVRVGFKAPTFETYMSALGASAPRRSFAAARNVEIKTDRPILCISSYTTLEALGGSIGALRLASLVAFRLAFSFRRLEAVWLDVAPSWC